MTNEDRQEKYIKFFNEEREIVKNLTLEELKERLAVLESMTTPESRNNFDSYKRSHTTK